MSMFLSTMSLIVFAMCVVLIGKLVAKLTGINTIDPDKVLADCSSRWAVLLTIPTYVMIPMIEEFMFRLPLILIFDSMTALAWLAAVCSAAAFAWMHLLNDSIMATHDQTDKAGKDVFVAGFKNRRRVHQLVLERDWMQCSRMLTFFGIGLACAYCGIVWHSIWMSFAVHVAYDLFLVLVMIVTFTSDKPSAQPA